jgi:hypothetical protein
MANMVVDETTGEILVDVDLERLTDPFPMAARKSRTGGGGRTFTYVDGTTVIHRLIEATHNRYGFSVDKYWSQDNSRLALVTLTIPGLGSRSHIGVQAEVANQGEDALAKGAITDGLKKAATLFGVGLELYGPDLNALPADGPSASPAPTRGAHGSGQAQSPQKPSSAAPSAPQRGIGTDAAAVQRGVAREQTASDSRIPDKYPRVDGKWTMADVVQWMHEANFSGVTDFGSAIKAAQAWGKQEFGIEDIIKHESPPKPGKEQYGNGTYPSAVVEAVSYWMDQQGGESNTTQAEAAPEDEDDVPF